MAAKYIDYLSEDSENEQTRGHKWVCISFANSENNSIKSIEAVKVRGVFRDREKADRYAKSLREKHKNFDVFVGEFGKWLGCNPNKETVEEEEYADKELNTLMKTLKENREKSKEMHAERKENMMREAAQEEDKKIQSSRNRMRKTLEQRRSAAENEEQTMKNEIDAQLSGKRKNNKKKNRKKDKKIEEKLKLMEETEKRMKEEHDMLYNEKKKLLMNQHEIMEMDKEMKLLEEQLGENVKNEKVVESSAPASC